MPWGRGGVWKCARLCLRTPDRAGNLPHGAARSEEVRALRRGVELGMEVIDTAEMYGTEAPVGEAVRGCRERAFPVGKVLPENADYAGTKRACEGSLRRLGTDYIDLYLLHWKGSFPIPETVRAMAELKREGKILQWGMGNPRRRNRDSESGGSGVCGGKFPQPQCGADRGGFARH